MRNGFFIFFIFFWLFFTAWATHNVVCTFIVTTIMWMIYAFNRVKKT